MAGDILLNQIQQINRGIARDILEKEVNKKQLG